MHVSIYCRLTNNPFGDGFRRLMRHTRTIIPKYYTQPQHHKLARTPTRIRATYTSLLVHTCVSMSFVFIWYTAKARSDMDENTAVGKRSEYGSCTGGSGDHKSFAAR